MLFIERSSPWLATKEVTQALHLVLVSAVFWHLAPIPYFLL